MALVELYLLYSELFVISYLTQEKTTLLFKKIKALKT